MTKRTKAVPTRTRIERLAWWLLDLLTSLKLTIVCLSLLMVLVVACTLAQVNLGTLTAVNLYIRSFFVWYEVPGTGWSLAVLPGGAVIPCFEPVLTTTGL